MRDIVITLAVYGVMAAIVITLGILLLMMLTG